LRVPPATYAGRVRDRLGKAYVSVATSSPRARVLAVAGLSLLIGLTLYRHVLPDDFVVYREAGDRLLHEPTGLYTDRPSLPFTYPPIAALLFVPLALVPGWLGAAALLTASLVALLRCADILSSWLRLGRLSWLAVAAAMLVLEPVISTLAYGQLNLILGAMVLTTLDRKGLAAGVWLGLAAALKLTPAVFFVPLLFRGSWQRCTVAVMSSVVATGVGFLVLPSESAQYWGSTLRQVGRVGAVAYAGNQALDGLIWREVSPGGASGLWYVCAGLLIAVTVFANVRTESMPIAACAAALGGLLVSPISWTHHWILAGAVAMVIWRMRIPFWSLLLASCWALVLVTWVVWWSTYLDRIGSSLPRPAWLLDNAYTYVGIASLIFLATHARRLDRLSAPPRSAGSSR
jgi:alpha-1,2-mannosyltransferase